MINFVKHALKLVLIALVALSFANFANAKDPDSKARLFERLAKAITQNEGREAEKEIWHYWFDQSPTPEIRKLLDRGMERRRSFDYQAAEDSLDQVVAQAPNYAEGYNQRAFVRFLRDNHTEALADLEKVLELEPNHFGALSGSFHVLRALNRHDAAFGMLKRAVEIHPWIQERALLPKHMQPEKIQTQEL